MRLSHALVLAALLPAPLLAQGMGGMGGMGGMDGRGGMGGRTGMVQAPTNRGLPKFATAKELERYNAADALLNERRKLKLTDDQVTQLSTLRGTLFERNADLLVRYDSVRRNFRVPKALEANAPSGSAPPTPQEMEVLREQMIAMMQIADSLVARRPEQLATVLALVTDDQKKDAEKELKSQSEELRKQVPERPRNRR